MPPDQYLSSRKEDHIQINLDRDVQSGLDNGLDQYRFIHCALPETSLEEVSLSLELFGKKLSAPLLISSMTGGTPRAAEINRILALAAQEAGIAMGLGSQRVALERPETGESFRVRRYAPDILLFANLGAVQLNYGYGIAECQQAVDMIEADALILHLNPLQEALQPEGNTNFSGLLKNIEKICRSLTVPVVVKEVGWGISREVAAALAEIGVSAIDVAGAGGTSWSQVEMYRMGDESRARIAAAFRNWGIPTAESILAVRSGAPKLPVFASGGLRNGIDIAKCLALGGTLGGMAGWFLKAANVSLDSAYQTVQEIVQELQICMFAVGAKTLKELDQNRIIRITGEQ